MNILDLLRDTRTGTVKLYYNHFRSDEPMTLLCTCEPSVAGITISQSAESANLSFYDLKEGAWKSVRTRTITGWDIV